eukprot:TRINITY_DN6081_c0_g3_i2.p1 TRINITY_DN6081_c0_g3~~TRINITY_DN6081_c0_g3_i2.p1  ORF type:complete len:252 (-),score=44.94 TRINITY_DN6081_c0_g3_i2:265-1020(-)
MAFLFSDDDGISPWLKQRRHLHDEAWWTNLLDSLEVSAFLYVGNISFYTTEEQLYEYFSRTGEVKRIIMGLNKNTMTPCGFCFVEYFSHEDAMDAKRFLSGMKCDERVVRVDLDPGYTEGREFGRGKHGGQVRDLHRVEYDPGRGGWSAMAEHHHAGSSYSGRYFDKNKDKGKGRDRDRDRDRGRARDDEEKEKVERNEPAPAGEQADMKVEEKAAEEEGEDSEERHAKRHRVERDSTPQNPDNELRFIDD